MNYPQAQCEIPAGSILNYRGIPLLIESPTTVHGTPDEIADLVIAIQGSQAHGFNGSPSSYRARPSDPDLNPVSVKDLSASASPATKEQQ